MTEMQDRFECSDCGEVLWDGPGEAPAEITAPGSARLRCSQCGSTARTGQSLASVTVGTSLGVTMVARHVINVDQLVIGFVGAHDRFRTAAGGNRPGDTLYPLFEALNWSVATDDRLTEDLRSTTGNVAADWTGKLRQRDRDLVVALRAARNVVHHRWETLIEGTWTGNNPRGSWVWQPLGQHAQGPRGKPRRGSGEYASTLDGLDVERSLEALRRIFLAQTADRAHEIETAAERVAGNLARP